MPDGVITPKYPAISKARTTAPVHFVASGTLASSGGSVNVEALRNNTGRPVELLEIRFMLVPGNTPFASAVNVITGAAVACRFTLNGEIPVSAKTLPVWLYARSYNMIVEMGNWQSTNQGAAGSDDGATFFSLSLAKPLYLRPGDHLIPEVQLLGQNAQPVTVYIGYSGRMLMSPAPTPRLVCVPYVSAYTSKVFDAYGNADSDSSTESDIVNPLDTPLHIQRFVHRMSIFDSTLTTQEYVEYDSGYADLASRLFQVKMTSAKGAALVPYFSSLNAVFSRMTRSWECEHDMAQSDYYLVELNKLAPTTTSVGKYNAQINISAIGWREVKLS